MVSTLSVIIKVPAELACRRRCKLYVTVQVPAGSPLISAATDHPVRIASRRMARDWCRRSSLSISIVMDRARCFLGIDYASTICDLHGLRSASVHLDRTEIEFFRLDAELARYRCWRGHRNHAEAARRIAGWIELRGAGEIRAQRIMPPAPLGVTWQLDICPSHRWCRGPDRGLNSPARPTARPLAFVRRSLVRFEVSVTVDSPGLE